MGMDQYIHIQDKSTGEVLLAAKWRKHYSLDSFIKQNIGKEDVDANPFWVELTPADIKLLATNFSGGFSDVETGIIFSFLDIHAERFTTWEGDDDYNMKEVQMYKYTYQSDY